MTSHQRLEVEAEAFYLMTGRLAPFKDSPVAVGPTNMADRLECWHKWRESYSRIILAMEAAFDEVMK